ncbi:MAG TPA: ATP-binding protein [Polyangiaceae bacterium]|nr:ATP-binding protein [Polyangiaceae bacterium]
MSMDSNAITASYIGTATTRAEIERLNAQNAALEEKLRRLSEALQRAEAVSHVVAGTVHDIRNSLTVVLGESSELLEGLRGSDLEESAQAIVQAGNHAAALSRDLLALAREEKARHAVVQTSEVVTHCRGLIRRAARDIPCSFDVDPAAWSIRLERQHLEAALINLSANARDAIANGRGSLRVSVHNRTADAPLPPGLAPGDYVVIVVEDTGCGMTPDVLARATDAFFTTREAAGGTGLGLAMVQSFVQNAGGGLRIDSAAGRGTRVELFLPRALAKQDRPCPPEHSVVRELERSVRTPWLVKVLEAWSLGRDMGGLPTPACMDAALIGHTDRCIVLEVDGTTQPPTFRLARLGAKLADALNSAALGELLLRRSDLVGHIDACYRRALRSRAPSYEYARHAFGNSPPFEFERLFLPVASDGETVSHLFGLVILSESKPGEPS